MIFDRYDFSLMIDTFNINSSYNSTLESRGKITSSIDQNTAYESDDEILNTFALPLIDLSNELLKMKDDDEKKDDDEEEEDKKHRITIIYPKLTSLLKSIKYTFDSYPKSFPYERFQAYWPDLFRDLHSIINEGHSTEDISIALYIIGYYFCNNSITIELIKSSDIISTYLNWLNDDEMIRNNFIASILAGISNLLKYEIYNNIKCNSEEDSISYYILSKHFEERLIYIYEKSGSDFDIDVPIMEISSMIKNLIKVQENDEFVPSLLKFLPILNDLIDSKVYELVRISIQSARHLITKFPDTRNNLDEINYVENLMNLIMSEDSSFGIFKSAIYFLNYYCSNDDERSHAIFTNDLANLAKSYVSRNYELKKIRHILIDIDCIMLNSKNLIYPVIDSELFDCLIDNAHNAPYNVMLVSSIILCDIIASNNIEAIQKVIDANFLECLQQMLTCEQPKIILNGLDTIVNLFMIGQGQADGQFLQSLRSQDWMPDTISELCDQDENDEEVVDAARYINSNIISVIFNQE